MSLKALASFNLTSGKSALLGYEYDLELNPIQIVLHCSTLFTKLLPFGIQ